MVIERKIDSIKAFSMKKKKPVRAKFRCNRPNGLEDDELQSYLIHM